ncbi:DNA -binding domain-containing protein [Acetobacter aceti]|uniref:DNA -binding domain-containing protein n=1 Tax=Acetobacter aceti TaxID=435 RepID=UPI0038D2276B
MASLRRAVADRKNILVAGGDERRIAAVLIDPRALTMPLDEWRDHAWRKSARDWRDEGIALVEGGYLKLLIEWQGQRGDFAPSPPTVQTKRQEKAPELKTLHTTDPICTPEDKARPRFVTRRGRLFYLAFLFLFFLFMIEYMK